MNELKLYRCDLCGNLIWMVKDAGVVPMCCGEEMTPVIANTVDAAVEKHVPVLCRKGKKVKISVGTMPHPMTQAHHISYIVLVTDKGLYIHELLPGDLPETRFKICAEEEVLAAYAWCNLHGLWKTEKEEELYED